MKISQVEIKLLEKATKGGCFNPRSYIDKSKETKWYGKIASAEV